MKRPRFVRACGLRIPVRFGTEKDYPELKGCYGCYDLDTCTIWIESSCPPAVQAFWIAHEAVHAVLNNSGALRMTATAFGIDMDEPEERKRMDSWEEALVRVLVPHILETFGPTRGCK